MGETGSMILAELGARECGHISLDEAIRLTALVALHDRDRGERYARRWLGRYLVSRRMDGCARRVILYRGEGGLELTRPRGA